MVLFTVILIWKLRRKVMAARIRINNPAGIIPGKNRRSTANSTQIKKTLTERKLQRATLLAILFAVNFIMCYSFHMLYYALPAFFFENISTAMEWLTNCNATTSLYLRFWYYYAASLSSLLNALIHLAVNDVVRDNITAITTLTREGMVKIRKLPSAIFTNAAALSSDHTAIGSGTAKHLELIAEVGEGCH